MINRLTTSQQVFAVLTVILLAVAGTATYLVLTRNAGVLSHRETSYASSPIVLTEIRLSSKPSSIAFRENSLYVAYSDGSRIDTFTPEGTSIDDISLPASVEPRSIAVGKGRIFLADKGGDVTVFDTTGEFVGFYRFLPDKKAEIRAASVTLNKDQLYVADSGLPGVLVISTVTFYGPVEKGEPVLLSQEGELILTIPEKRFRPTWVTEEWDLKDPTYALVSPDGRVLVSDKSLRMVKVYTSTGMYAYPFEKGKKGDKNNTLACPVAMAYDNLANPEYLKEKKSFDPSGIRGHGRVHVVDKTRGEVFVYTTTGNFLFTYGQGVLSKPTSIAVDTKDRLIFVADSGHHRITIWGY